MRIVTFLHNCKLFVIDNLKYFTDQYGLSINVINTDATRIWAFLLIIPNQKWKPEFNNNTLAFVQSSSVYYSLFYPKKNEKYVSIKHSVEDSCEQGTFLQTTLLI